MLKLKPMDYKYLTQTNPWVKPIQPNVTIHGLQISNPVQPLRYKTHCDL